MTTRPLTWRRSLVSVVVALTAGVAASVGCTAVGSSLARGVESSDSTPFAGLGYLLLAGAIGLFAGYLLAIVGVLLGTVGRVGGGRFTLVFAGVLTVILAVFVFSQGIGSLFLAALPDASPLNLVAVALAPQLWVLPAAATRLVRPRWLLVVSAAGLAAALVIGSVSAFAGQQQQSALNSAYDGPVYAPSTSPSSPLAGFHLRGVELPNGYATYDGAVLVSLSYVSPGPGSDASGDRYYDLGFSATHNPDACPSTPTYSSCTEVGTALGAPVRRSESSGDYLIELPRGAVTVTGSLTPAEALTVLDDLQPSTVDAVSRLHVTTP
ncbi:hypothetical protein B7R54_14645 [Subtercola boreus]|uniref:Uncharacterized protein n=1 Tax=Subtercola boreus TaxID=120213 RepID=A0A3E0VKY3_9MICO|nr:hypothetical protein [Subtercola boreus]RFA10309.1 hypothetical protein B7R54_14645 [Subtercola boreus]TQL56186.1 hypothetical protein FB464_3773 [Subtercola boreus]